MPTISKQEMLRLTSPRLQNNERVYKDIQTLIHYEEEKYQKKYYLAPNKNNIRVIVCKK